MKKIIFKPIFETVRRWYIPLITGLFFVIAALFAIFFPKVSLITLAVFFSVSFLLSGISEIIFSVSNAKTLQNWGWHLAMGILTAIVGIILLRDPNLTVNVLAFFVGFTFLFRSISTISLSIDIKNYGIENWGYLLALGILGAVVSIVLIANPVFTGISIVVLMALAFMLLGIFQIYFAFQLKKVHKYVRKVRPEIKEKFKKLVDELYDNWKDISLD